MQSAALAGAADPQRELNETEKDFHDSKVSPRYDCTLHSLLIFLDSELELMTVMYS